MLLIVLILQSPSPRTGFFAPCCVFLGKMSSVAQLLRYMTAIYMPQKFSDRIAALKLTVCLESRILIYYVRTSSQHLENHRLERTRHHMICVCIVAWIVLFFNSDWWRCVSGMIVVVFCLLSFCSNFHSVKKSQNHITLFYTYVQHPWFRCCDIVYMVHIPGAVEISLDSLAHCRGVVRILHLVCMLYHHALLGTYSYPYYITCTTP